MDLSKAVLVSLLVFALVEAVKQQCPSIWKKVPLLVVGVVGEAVTFGVAASDWGHENIIMGRPLDKLSIVSLVLAGLVVSASALGINKVLGAVSNIGENQPAAVPSSTSPGIHDLP